MLVIELHLSSLSLTVSALLFFFFLFDWQVSWNILIAKIMKNLTFPSRRLNVIQTMLIFFFLLEDYNCNFSIFTEAPLNGKDLSSMNYSAGVHL